MTALAEKLKSAGIDTLGAKLTTACTEAVRRHPDSVVNAWLHIGAIFGHEFVRGIMNDMQRASLKKEGAPPTTTPLSRNNHPIPLKPYKPHVVPADREHHRSVLRHIVRSKYKNSGGVPWSDVGIHEGHALMRDGVEAAALDAALPNGVPNTGKTYGDVLGVKKVEEIIAKVRREK